jgi:hypothetical protein
MARRGVVTLEAFHVHAPSSQRELVPHRVSQGLGETPRDVISMEPGSGVLQPLEPPLQIEPALDRATPPYTRTPYRPGKGSQPMGPFTILLGVVTSRVK